MLTQCELKRNDQVKVYWLGEEKHGDEYQRLRPGKTVVLAEEGVGTEWLITRTFISLSDERAVPKQARYGTILDLFEAKRWTATTSL